MITISKSPFHSKSVLSQVDAVACAAVYRFAATQGRSWKVAWLAAQKEFAFAKNLNLSTVKHFAGEIRAVGEYVTREGWRMGLSWHDAAANARGAHMIKRDIDPNDRKLHAAATEILRKRGSVSLPNTWAGQTAALKSEKGAEALKLATAALKKEAAVTKPAKK